MADRSYDAPVLTVSAAAELAGMHAQTLRQYDRLGLVVPHRTAGRGRRYSLRDVAALREVQRLSLEGVNLEGISRILALQRENAALLAALEGLRSVIDPGSRVFAASTTGDVESVPRGRRARTRPTAEAGSGVVRTSGALVLWRPGR
ncbi:heat shock protein transcriptional repressor HspR [Litorihabitans aurantiacus]|uniref:Transcriptional regulator n=1 Tax=Litorihabitans aurantiacus TaxID=1930061 RepID=A0AA37XGL8_9MICO|nr:MerR family transcriptional regulator [Litorihabitans aurantiacus]GMA32631.1 transcriptional regulator [Litorihabitans aurantiacus]